MPLHHFVSFLTLVLPALRASFALTVDRRGVLRSRHVGTGNATEVTNEFCVNGRLLPQMYMLGAQKAGTTFFAYHLMQAGVETADRSDLVVNKEWHFFDQQNQSLNQDSAPKLGKVWRKELPRCHTRNGHRLLADFTIINLGLVPLPEGTHPSGTQWGHYMPLTDPKGGSMNLPAALGALYPQALQPNLRFLVLLREPVARMLSAWAHAAELNFEVICKDCAGSGFVHSLKRTLNLATANHPQIDDWLWHSMYARQMDSWLQTFHERQFSIHLFQDVIGPNSASYCEEVISWAGFDAACPTDVAETHQNGHAHIGVDELEKTHETLFKKFREFMEPETKRLVGILAKGHSSGMRLHGYIGSHIPSWLGGNSDSHVRKWLEKGW